LCYVINLHFRHGIGAIDYSNVTEFVKSCAQNTVGLCDAVHSEVCVRRWRRQLLSVAQAVASFASQLSNPVLYFVSVDECPSLIV